MKKKEEFQVKKGQPYPLGVTITENAIQFAYYHPTAKKCQLCLYHKDARSKKPAVVIDVPRAEKSGYVFACIISREEGKPDGHFSDEYEYAILADGKEVRDIYAVKAAKATEWGTVCRNTRYCLGLEKFDWENTECPGTTYEDSIFYQLHVRGFTKHASSQVEGKGTFLGLKNKIPYLKELGITAVLVLPVYGFHEMIEKKESYQKLISDKINYWGYSTENDYFMPKAAYAHDELHPETELKELIKSLHKENIEFIMDFFFPEGTSQGFILECLRFWALEYHVDGFRVNDNVVMTSVIAQDPVIGTKKLLASNWDNTKPLPLKNKAVMNEMFQNTARRYLKSDEGQVEAFSRAVCANPAEHAIINYITSVNGFTLLDLVSYDVKHNEENGEDGRDGSEYNYSWNCGVEGPSRKKLIVQRRISQMKNALMMLFLSQGTPMLLAGDELCNTQNGNNNAYCQDNPVAWLNWDIKKSYEEIFTFTKQLIAFRKTYAVFRKSEAYTMRDTLSDGYPDLSLHGITPWSLDFSFYNRVFAMFYNGVYHDNKQNEDYYVAYNLYWEKQDFSLPTRSKNYCWEVMLSSGESVLKENILTVPARTITVLCGKKVQEEIIQKKKIKKNKLE